MMTGGARLWLQHGLAFAFGLAVLFGSGEVGETLFAGLKVAPLVWHLVIAVLAVILSAIAYAGVIRLCTGRALTRLFPATVGVIAVGFVVMALLIYFGWTTAQEAFFLCASAIFILGGMRLMKALS